MRTAVTIIGVLAVLIGLLWVCQGLGLVHWPASSFMLDQRVWSIYGGILALAGAAAIWWSRRAR